MTNEKKYESIIDEITNDLIILPQTKLDTTIKLYTWKTRLDEIKEQMDQIELQTEMGVEASVDENGKAKFSNVTKRRYEQTRILDENEQHQAMKKEYNALRRDIEDLQIKLDFYKDKMKSAVALTRICGGE